MPIPSDLHPPAVARATPPAQLRHWGRSAKFFTNQATAFLRAIAVETLPGAPRPQRQGRIVVDGPDAPIEILRDEFGVPHCYAQSAADALFAMGFVHVQDRFWQMEIFRRMAAGRLAEVVGPSGLPMDRLMRYIGLHRASVDAWAQTPDDVRDEVAPYLAGIQAAIACTPPPLEVRILNYQPEDWRPEHSIQGAKALAFFLAPGWLEQIERARLVEAAGLDVLLAIDPSPSPDDPVVVPPGAPYGALSQDLRSGYAEIVKLTGLTTTGFGSNNWAVAGHKTDSGHAFLAADPHLSANVPPSGYFLHLDCPEWSVAGATFPGLPGVIWGFNRHVAWGPTAGLAVTQDLYVEEFDDRGRYRTPDGWEQPDYVHERIRVRGFPDEHHRVPMTRHGPVVSSQVHGVRLALALRSTLNEPWQSAKALLALNATHDFASFRAALAEFHEFNLCFAYSDGEGQIGMQTCGAIPKRRTPAAGWLPAPGWDPAFDWDGYIPRDELPSTFNPAAGRVWSANNALAPAAQLGFRVEALDAFRARRIGQALCSEGMDSFEAARELQIDCRSLPMLALRDHLLSITPRSATERRLLGALRDWNGDMAPDSVPAAVAAATFGRLLDTVLRAKLGAATPVFFADLLPVPTINPILARAASMLMGLLDESPAEWFGPVASGVDGRTVWNTALTRAFRDALAILRDRLGSRPERWTWGRCHQLHVRHVFGESPVLGRLFNQGPYPLCGDANTVWQAAPLSTDAFAPVVGVPILRLIVEMGPQPRAEFALAGAQSGQRGGAQPVDLLHDWRQGRYRPLHTQRAAVEAAARQRLELVPNGRGTSAAASP